MGRSRDTTPPWPGEDPAAIAFATRVVLLMEATRTCILGSISPDQEEMLMLLQLATDMRLVRGRSFAEFLEATNIRLAQDVDNHGLEDAAATLEQLEGCEP